MPYSVPSSGFWRRTLSNLLARGAAIAVSAVFLVVGACELPEGIEVQDPGEGGVEISKSVQQNRVDASDTLRYRIEVTNSLTEAVVVDVIDSLPEGVVFDAADGDEAFTGNPSQTDGELRWSGVRVSGTAAVNLRLIAPADPDVEEAGDDLEITNVARVVPNASGGIRVDRERASAVARVTPLANLDADLMVERRSDPSAAALRAAHGDEPQVCPGDEFQYTLTIRNDGPSTARNVRVTSEISGHQDELPLTIEWRVDGDLIANDDGLQWPTIETLEPAETIDGRLFGSWSHNSAELKHGLEVDSDTKVEVDPEGVRGDVEAAANLTVTVIAVERKGMAPITSIQPGEEFRYLVRVENEGPCTARVLTVKSQLPGEGTPQLPAEWLRDGDGSSGADVTDMNPEDGLDWISDSEDLDPGASLVGELGFTAPQEPNGSLGHSVEVSWSVGGDDATDEDESEVAVESPSKVLEVTPESLTFETSLGIDPDGETLTVSNAGEGELEWSATANRDWLSVDPSDGTILEGDDPTDVTVDVESSDLEVGEHSAEITFEAPGAEPKVVSVELTVEPQPVLEVSVEGEDEELKFQVTAGGEQQQEIFTVKNAGGGDMGWNVAEPDEEWLTVEPRNGELGADESAQVTVTVDPSHPDLATPGDYPTTIVVSASGVEDSPQNVRVELEVTPP